jgi:hypothetical protein
MSTERYHDIEAYGGVGDGRTDCTAALHQALEACRSAGGGTVVVPPGRFRVAAFNLPSHTTLRLEAGGVLVASPEINDYHDAPFGKVRPQAQNVTWLWADGEQGLRIEGPGTIDLSGSSFMDFDTPRTGPSFSEQMIARLTPEQKREVAVDYRPRPKWSLLFHKCRDIRFDGVTILDPPAWTTRFAQCRDIVIRGLRLDADPRVPNSDGLHFNSCADVLIADSIIRCGDDAIAITGIGSEDVPVERFLVHGCVLSSRSSGIRLGHKNAIVRDCRFENCIVTGSNRGIGVFAEGGGRIERVRFRGFRIDARLFAGNWWGHGEPIMLFSVDNEDGWIRDVQFEDIEATCEQGAVFFADPAGTVRDLKLSNLRLDLRTGPNAELMGGVLDLQPAPLRERTIPALLLAGVHRAELHDIQVREPETKPDWLGPPLEIEQCRDIRTDPTPVRLR